MEGRKEITCTRLFFKKNPRRSALLQNYVKFFYLPLHSGGFPSQAIRTTTCTLGSGAFYLSFDLPARFDQKRHAAHFLCGADSHACVISNSNPLYTQFQSFSPLLQSPNQTCSKRYAAHFLCVTDSHPHIVSDSTCSRLSFIHFYTLLKHVWHHFMFD